MRTPFTTPTGVQIGLLYTKPLPAIQGDALRLQAALLEKRTSTPLTPLIGVLGSIWKFL